MGTGYDQGQSTGIKELLANLETLKARKALNVVKPCRILVEVEDGFAHSH